MKKGWQNSSGSSRFPGGIGSHCTPETPGSINYTPLELAIRNQIDRFDLAIDVIDRVPRISVSMAHFKDHLKDSILESTRYAFEYGADKPQITDWKWPHGTNAR